MRYLERTKGGSGFRKPKSPQATNTFLSGKPG
jgi:hypothetical protein